MYILFVKILGFVLKNLWSVKFIYRLSGTYLSKQLILVKEASILEINNFDHLDFEKKYI